MKKSRIGSNNSIELTLSNINNCINDIEKIREIIKKNENPLNVITEHNCEDLEYVNWICSFNARDFS